MKFPITAGTASRTSFPGSDVPVGPNILPFPSQHPQTSRAFSPSRTANSAWQAPPNPSAGNKENEWFEKNLAKLGSYAGLWIAIKGKRMLASSSDLEEILDWLTSQHVADALVVQVPDDVNADRYMLA